MTPARTVTMDRSGTPMTGGHDESRTGTGRAVGARSPRLVGLQRADVHTLLRGSPRRHRPRPWYRPPRRGLRRRVCPPARCPARSLRHGVGRDAALARRGPREGARRNAGPGRPRGPLAVPRGKLRCRDRIQLGSVRRRPGVRGPEHVPGDPPRRTDQLPRVGSARGVRERRIVPRGVAP